MYDFDIIVPVFNEGKNILRLFEHLKFSVRSNYRILICYDSEDDNLFNYLEDIRKFNLNFLLVKNKNLGPCHAVISGFKESKCECKIVYPADDFINGNILDQMYKNFKEGSDIVVASRFMKGGSMVNCPFPKNILVRMASYTLYKFSSIPVEDASNGFRLFSKTFLDSVEIESTKGFAFSLELLVKAERQKRKITQVPAQWEERSVGQSRFNICKWFNQYLKWYFYGLKTSLLKIKYF